jgi:hypothetical protein
MTGLNGVRTTPSAITFGPRGCNIACGSLVRRGAIGLPHNSSIAVDEMTVRMRLTHMDVRRARKPLAFS